MKRSTNSLITIAANTAGAVAELIDLTSAAPGSAVTAGELTESALKTLAAVQEEASKYADSLPSELQWAARCIRREAPTVLDRGVVKPNVRWAVAASHVTPLGLAALTHAKFADDAVPLLTRSGDAKVTKWDTARAIRSLARKQLGPIIAAAKIAVEADPTATNVKDLLPAAIVSPSSVGPGTPTTDHGYSYRPDPYEQDVWVQADKTPGPPRREPFGFPATAEVNDRFASIGLANTGWAGQAVTGRDMVAEYTDSVIRTADFETKSDFGDFHPVRQVDPGGEQFELDLGIDVGATR